MKRNAVLSIIIGVLATYLPFWRWTDTFTQISAAVVIAMLVFYFLVGTEKDPVKRQLSFRPLTGMQQLKEGSKQK